MLPVNKAIIPKKAPIANLPNGVSVYKDGGNWRVRLGKKFTGGAPRKARFEMLSEAREWIFGDAKTERVVAPPVVQLKGEGGSGAFQLTHEQIREATAAIKALGDQGTLMEAVNFFLKNARPAGGMKTFSELADFYITLKRDKNRSDKHCDGLQSIFSAFAEDFGDQPVHTIRQESAEEWLNELDLEPGTVGNYIRDLRSVFKEGTRRQWCVVNPFANIEKPDVEAQEIVCLQAPQIAALLMKCPPELIRPMAIKIFAGLRTSELLRLDEAQIKKSEIIVMAKNAKTRSRRVVTIHPNLAAWLAASKPDGGGPVWKKGQNAYHDAVNRLAEEACVELTSNCFRQTFASHHLAKFKKENLTAVEMGNSPKMIFKHYRAVATAAEAKLYWNVTPKTAEAIAVGEIPKITK